MEVKKYIGKLTDDAVMSCSRLPALFGLSPWSSPNDELKKSMRALGVKFTDDHNVFTGNEAAKHGNALEGYILKTGAERLGLEADLEITERIESSEISLQGSLDGILYGDGRVLTTDKDAGIYCYNAESVTLDGPGVAEAKLTGAPPDDQPAPYRGPIQCQGLQICGGYKWHAIFTLFRGTELRIFVGATDAAMQAKIRAEVTDFQSRIDLFKTDGVTDWYAAMTPNDAASIFAKPESDLPELVLEGDINEMAIEMLSLRRKKKEIDEKIQSLQTMIMDHMGLHETAYAMHGDRAIARLTWPMTPASKEYVVKARPSTRGKTLRIKEYHDA